MNSKLSITIGWLYPTLMSTYGDRGNIICLTKRLEWRGINANIVPIDQETDDQRLKTVDLLFGGGAQDREQEIVMRDLMKKKEAIKKRIEEDMPALFVCGSPQLMGRYYEPAEGKRIQGLGIFDMISVHPGKDQPRCIGNIIGKINWDVLKGKPLYDYAGIAGEFVGFENHGGRTYLGKDVKPFATVMQGFGNNGEDGTEGVVYRNAIGSYSHGPLLPKNPHFADFLIKLALDVKYGKDFNVGRLLDAQEVSAHKAIARRLGVRV